MIKEESLKEQWTTGLKINKRQYHDIPLQQWETNTDMMFACATQLCIPTFLTILSHVTKYSPSAAAMPAVALSEGLFSQKLNGLVENHKWGFR